jgi:hypothetical protein
MEPVNPMEWFEKVPNVISFSVRIRMKNDRWSRQALDNRRETLKMNGHFSLACRVDPRRTLTSSMLQGTLSAVHTPSAPALALV